MPFPLIGAGVSLAVGASLRSAVGWAITGLGRLFGSRIGQWVAAGLAYFGLAFATQTFAVDPILDELSGYMSGVTGDLVEWLGFLNVDRACTMIMSAVAIKYGMQAAKTFLARR